MGIKDRMKRLLGKEKAVNVKHKFTEIHDKNLFHGVESVSGTGSDMVQTEEIRKRIPELIEKYGITSVMDAPCGDFFWMRHVDLGGGVKYVGIDIVESLIEKNNQEHSDGTHSFACIDIIEGDLPKVDLIICRDCLVHLTYDQAINAIRNFKGSGAKYLLTTTFPGRENRDLGDIIWRPLDLQEAPFSLPEPVELINEKCTEDDMRFTDKSLGMWDLSFIEI